VTQAPHHSKNPWNILGWLLVVLVIALVVITVLMIIGTATLTPHR